MTPREAFKIGFLTTCADLGLNGPQAAALMTKAAGLLEKQALGLGDLGSLVGTTALTVPVLAGAGMGYLAHRAAVPEWTRTTSRSVS
jgi:hypothetical protein